MYDLKWPQLWRISVTLVQNRIPIPKEMLETETAKRSVVLWLMQDFPSNRGQKVHPCRTHFLKLVSRIKHVLQPLSYILLLRFFVILGQLNHIIVCYKQLGKRQPTDALSYEIWCMTEKCLFPGKYICSVLGFEFKGNLFFQSFRFLPKYMV